MPPVAPGTDTDGDGIADTVEVAYNLDLLDPSDTSLDCDGDGLSNAANRRRHAPARLFTRYLAEGATGAFFSTRAGAAQSRATAPPPCSLRFLKTDGTVVTQLITVGAGARARPSTLGSVAGLATAEFSTVHRGRRAGRRRPDDELGCAAATAATPRRRSPPRRTTWYLAEGATHSGFDLFYLIQNPNADRGHGRASPTCGRRRRRRSSRPTSSPPTAGSTSGSTREDPARSARDRRVGAIVTLDRRACRSSSSARCISNAGGQPFGAGHDSAGVTAPATSWFLAEGATGPFFDLFMLIANPERRDAAIDGALSAARRHGRDQELHGRRQQPLQHLGRPRGSRGWPTRRCRRPSRRPTACRSSSSGRCGGRADGGDLARGAQHRRARPTTGTRGRWPKASWAAPATRDLHPDRQHRRDGASVRVTLLFEDGTTAEREFPLTAQSRFNVAVRAEFPAASVGGSARSSRAWGRARADRRRAGDVHRCRRRHLGRRHQPARHAAAVMTPNDPPLASYAFGGHASSLGRGHKGFSRLEPDLRVRAVAERLAGRGTAAAAGARPLGEGMGSGDGRDQELSRHDLSGSWLLRLDS